MHATLARSARIRCRRTNHIVVPWLWRTRQLAAIAGGVSIDETAMIPALRRVRQLTLALGATGTVALAVSRALDPTQRSRAKSYFTQPHRTAAMTSGLEALTGLHRKERGAPSDALTDPGFPDARPYTEADPARHDETDDEQFYSQPRQ